METIQEYKRTCKSCGRVWHSLVEREKKLERSAGCERGYLCCSACGDALETRKERNVAGIRQNMDVDRLRNIKTDLRNVKTCPECGSSNYDEELIKFEKQ